MNLWHIAPSLLRTAADRQVCVCGEAVCFSGWHRLLRFIKVLLSVHAVAVQASIWCGITSGSAELWWDRRVVFVINPHTKKRGYENIIHFWQHDKNSIQASPDTAKSFHAIKSRLYPHPFTPLVYVPYDRETFLCAYLPSLHWGRLRVSSRNIFVSPGSSEYSSVIQKDISMSDWGCQALAVISGSNSLT